MKTRISTLTLLVAATLLATPALLVAGTAAHPASGIEGSWIVAVTLDEPPPGFPPSFTALETYSRGGGMVTSNDTLLVGRPGQGAFQRRGDHVQVTITFLLVDPEVGPVGSIVADHTLEVNGDTYTGAGQANILDADGNLLVTATFTSQGARLVP